MDAFSAVLLNAERLLNDARILASHGSGQSATALAILSQEESGKACIIKWKLSGYIDRDVSHEILSGHINKQRVFYALRFASSAVESIIEKLLSVGIGGHIDFSELQESIAKLGYNSSWLHKFSAESGLQDYIKQNGFYMDVSGDLSKFRSDFFLSDKDQKRTISEAQEAIYLARRDAGLHKIAATVYESEVFDPKSRIRRTDIDRTIDEILKNRKYI